MPDPTNSRKISAPHYPIIYVRGYAMDTEEREQTFHDAYYGFSASSVEKRQATAEMGSRLPISSKDR